MDFDTFSNKLSNLVKISGSVTYELKFLEIDSEDDGLLLD